MEKEYDGNVMNELKTKYIGRKKRKKTKAGPRRADFETKWKVDTLWVNPFREERRFVTDGTHIREEWVRLDDAEKDRTGIPIMDEWLRYLSKGGTYVKDFCSGYSGLRRSDLDTMTFILTGMGLDEFQKEYRLKTLRMLLKYTDMPLDEVARYAGCGSKHNVYMICRREWNMAPMKLRKSIQESGDAGRYRM